MMSEFIRNGWRKTYIYTCKDVQTHTHINIMQYIHMLRATATLLYDLFSVKITCKDFELRRFASIFARRNDNSKLRLQHYWACGTRARIDVFSLEIYLEARHRALVVQFVGWFFVDIVVAVSFFSLEMKLLLKRYWKVNAMKKNGKREYKTNGQSEWMRSKIEIKKSWLGKKYYL